MANENKNNQDDFAANLFQQITNISKASAYDILLDQHKKLEERNKVLEDALRKIDAISFHKNDWEEMCKIGEIAKEALLNNHK